MSKRCMGCMELFGNEFDICPHCGYVEGTKAEEAIHMEPGTLLYDRYIIGKVLGFGGFGVTYIGWDGKLEQKVAIKEYLPSEFSTRMPGQSSVTVFNGDKSEQFRDGLDKFVEEAKRLAKFQNEPGIVKVFDSFTENETAYIVMEFLDGETLTERLKRDKTISEDEAVGMLLPVMNSLQDVHSEGILHRDIAPDNIFLTKSGDVKLIDFGASRYATTSHSRSLTVIIKPGYSPEEQYRSRGDQGPHTDVYALAATLYKMITGKTPPDAMERRAKIENQKKEILEDPHKINKNISLNRENAILNAMNVRIEDRTADVGSFINELNADPPVKRRHGKIKKIDLYAWPIWLKILLPAILAILITFGVLLGTGVISFPSLFSDEVVVPEGVVIVPDVEGMDKDEALKLINDNNLAPSPEGNIESEYVEAGKIVLQTPIGGSYLDENGIVVLTVSSGVGVVGAENGISTVPYVIWDNQDDAIAKLKAAGLAEPIIITQSDENVAEGKVISQSVDSGTKVAEGTQITITVSTGPALFNMPNVVGSSKANAEKTLSSKGLIVSIQYEKNDNVAEGNVITQSVKAGTSVKKGTNVTLTVSSGKPTILVSNVVGKGKNNAIDILERQGFKVSVLENYDSTVESGKVISQSPAAGTSQIKGSTITIYVSKGERPWIYADNLDGIDKSKVEIQYSYRDKSTTTSTSSSLSGWTSNGSFVEYGSWTNVGWTSTKPTESATLEITDTKTIPATYKTQYNYSRYFQYSNFTGKHGPWKREWGGIYCQYYQERGWSDSKLSVYEVQRAKNPNTNNYENFNCYGSSSNAWFNEDTRSVQVTPAYTQWYYRTRTATTKYNYYKWGSWSGYSTSSVSPSSTREVRYRYRLK